MYKEYLVTGATGFLGRAVTNELTKRGAAVRALVLPGDPLKDSLPDTVKVFCGDVCDRASLEAFFENTDRDTCLIHCAGIISVASAPGQKLYDVNVGGTENMLFLAERQGIGRMVYVSSVHALPELPKGVCMTETDRFSPSLVQGDYAKSKAMATAKVLQAAGDGLNVSVILPSGIIGPGDECGGSITYMLRSFLRGRLPLAVRGGYDFVDVRDVARGIADCCDKGERGRCYILSGHYTTVKELLRTAGKVLNVRRLVSYLPIGLAKRIAPLYEKYSLRRKKPLIFTPYSIAVLDSNGEFSHAAARDAFGYAPRSLSDTLRDTLTWLKEKGTPKKKKCRARITA